MYQKVKDFPNGRKITHPSSSYDDVYESLLDRVVWFVLKLKAAGSSFWYARSKEITIVSFINLPGCSLHCEHFFENAITPSFSYGIIWIFSMLLFDVLSMNVIFQNFDYFWPKKTNLWAHFEFFCRFLRGPNEFGSFCVGFSSGKT